MLVTQIGRQGGRNPRRRGVVQTSKRGANQRRRSPNLSIARLVTPIGRQDGRIPRKRGVARTSTLDAKHQRPCEVTDGSPPSMATEVRACGPTARLIYLAWTFWCSGQ